MALQINQDLQYTLGDSNSCNTDPRYWIPVVLDDYSNGQYNWSNDARKGDSLSVSNLKWSISQPNAYGIEKCVGVKEISGEYYANDIDCDKPLCSVCNIPLAHPFYLRGPGPEGLNFYHRIGIRDFLDRKYSLLLEAQKNSSHLVFGGQTGLSQMTWYPSDKMSIIKRYDNQEITQGKIELEMPYFVDPFGRYKGLNWIFTNVNGFRAISIKLIIKRYLPF